MFYIITFSNTKYIKDMYTFYIYKPNKMCRPLYIMID